MRDATAGAFQQIESSSADTSAPRALIALSPGRGDIIWPGTQRRDSSIDCTSGHAWSISKTGQVGNLSYNPGANRRSAACSPLWMLSGMPTP